LLDKLEFLLALAREKHFGRAAEACGVTQPTLSAGVKQLEETFGVMLVNRGSRFQGFTAEGERVLEWARRIVGDTRAMRQEVHALKHGLAGRLRLAAIPTALAMVETLTTPFRARHPEVQFTVLSRTSTEILAHLENLEIDAGLTYLDNEPLGRVTTIPLYRERYRLLVAADAPLGDRQTVTWTEVAQVPLCLLTPDMQNRRATAARYWHQSAYNARVGLDDTFVLACTHRTLGERHAGPAGCIAWIDRRVARNPDR
jgi:DNA-binding transcriptional LysR family regulator